MCECVRACVCVCVCVCMCVCWGGWVTAKAYLGFAFLIRLLGGGLDQGAEHLGSSVRVSMSACAPVKEAADEPPLG